MKRRTGIFTWVRKPRKSIIPKTGNPFVYVLIIASFFGQSCNESITMREMAQEFCDCANYAISNGATGYSVMDSCSVKFMDYQKYPTFFYVNGGTHPDGEEAISIEEYNEYEDQYMEFLDYRNEICGH